MCPHGPLAAAVPPKQPPACCGWGDRAPRTQRTLSPGRAGLSPKVGPSALGELVCLQRCPRFSLPAQLTASAGFISSVCKEQVRAGSVSSLGTGSVVSLLGGFSSAEMSSVCPTAKSAAFFKGSRSFEWKTHCMESLSGNVPSHYLDQLKDLGSILCLFRVCILSYSVEFHLLSDPSAF